MKHTIGFRTTSQNSNEQVTEKAIITEKAIPKKSMVQVHFDARHMTLAYYNDSFDLHIGDTVYVDGKLEGLKGIVTEVNYSFKIKLSDYKRVIAVADTTIQGELFFAGSHMVAFDKSVIPYSKVALWFMAPETDNEYACGSNEEGVPLSDLCKMNIDHDAVEKGYDYYNENKVCYLCLDGTHGRAIISGSKYYDVEFDYINGEIYNLVCSCYCTGSCKHEFAAMLQLRNTLDFIDKNYTNEHKNYFAAISKDVFIYNAIVAKDSGKIIV